MDPSARDRDRRDRSLRDPRDSRMSDRDRPGLKATEPKDDRVRDPRDHRSSGNGPSSRDIPMRNSVETRIRSMSPPRSAGVDRRRRDVSDIGSRGDYPRDRVDDRRPMDVVPPRSFPPASGRDAYPDDRRGPGPGDRDRVRDDRSFGYRDAVPPPPLDDRGSFGDHGRRDPYPAVDRERLGGGSYASERDRSSYGGPPVDRGYAARPAERGYPQRSVDRGYEMERDFPRGREDRGYAPPPAADDRRYGEPHVASRMYDDRDSGYGPPAGDRRYGGQGRGYSDRGFEPAYGDEGGFGGRGGGRRDDRGGYGGRRMGGPRQGAPQPSGTEEERRTSTQIFVGSLPYSFTEKDIWDMMERYGKLKKVTMPKDRDTGKNKGFAFVDFEERRDAEDAFDKYDGYTLEGRRLRLDWDVGRDKKGGPSGNDAIPRDSGASDPSGLPDPMNVDANGAGEYAGANGNYGNGDARRGASYR
ncbi:RNA-binding domain-containing protein [Gonapodya prolifera JEL478]|uniref:RNA-binding domain-containing protein n=1 Tax=Gonapodya prolifera (strain JEL478) TaxID=1344416 RepID=A0A139A1M4_GONPJ|nr:RNA-binding domain-containing protein [Gonapodya prolifera JEL478]|eukprot:KXS10528.1 RNA-binding domain-containing protein [Gonapodya prolifera JEL478]